MDSEKLSFLSKTKGADGSIKNSPEDFLVEEIANDGTVLELDRKLERNDEEGQYVHFVMQKREWTTEGAIRRIAKQLRTSKRRFNYAGNKDKIAVSTQLVSAFDIPKEQIASIDLKDIKINGAWTAADKVKLGNLLGNRFTVTAKGMKNPENVQVISGELRGKFPNYFGEQRFGTSRRNTHLIGEQILRGRYDKAAMMFLSDSEGETNEDARNARKHLAETEDFSAAVKEFPRYLKLERSMLEHLAKHQNDYVGSMRVLPRATLLMFVHAFQSYIFNRLLSDRISGGKMELEEGEYYCGENPFGFPDIDNKAESGWIAGKLIGYETELNEREKNLLEELDIRKNDFKIKGIPELSSKGQYRTLFAPLKDFSFEGDVFRFELPAGSYATVALREFLEVNKA